MTMRHPLLPGYIMCSVCHLIGGGGGPINIQMNQPDVNSTTCYLLCYQHIFGTLKISSNFDRSQTGPDIEPDISMLGSCICNHLTNGI